MRLLFHSIWVTHVSYIEKIMIHIIEYSQVYNGSRLHCEKYFLFFLYISCNISYRIVFMASFLYLFYYIFGSAVSRYMVKCCCDNISGRGSFTMANLSIVAKIQPPYMKIRLLSLGLLSPVHALQMIQSSSTARLSYLRSCVGMST